MYVLDIYYHMLQIAKDIHLHQSVMHQILQIRQHFIGRHHCLISRWSYMPNCFIFWYSYHQMHQCSRNRCMISRAPPKWSQTQVSSITYSHSQVATIADLSLGPPHDAIIKHLPSLYNQLAMGRKYVASLNSQIKISMLVIFAFYIKGANVFISRIEALHYFQPQCHPISEIVRSWICFINLNTYRHFI